MQQQVEPNPLRRGAEDGLRFGLYLIALFFTSIFSPQVPFLGLISLALMIGVPFVVGWLMVRYRKQNGGVAKFTMLFTQGIMIFLCGMLIAGVVLVIYMKWIDPQFILTQWQAMAAFATAGTTPGMQQLGFQAQAMIEAGALPSAISIVFEFTMLAVGSGAVLSLILAACFARRLPKLRND